LVTSLVDTARPPTLRDVAARAGVSVSLASLAIRGSNRVSEHSRRAILRAADELEYRPNAAARNLRRQRTELIGALVTDLRNPFHTDVVEGLEDAAEKSGFRVVIANAQRDEARSRALIDDLIELRVEGLVLIGSRLDDVGLGKVGLSVPTVIVGSQGEEVDTIDAVVNDDALGTRLAVEHLLDLGHIDIAHISGGTRAAHQARRAGYEAAMREAGLEDAIRVVAGDTTEDGGAAGASALLTGQRLPTAVICANDLAAIGARSRLERAGLQVPEGISIVGYDNTWVAAMRHVSLTTVDQPRARMGGIAIDLILSRRRGRTEPRRVRLQPQLAIRTTTARPPTSAARSM
jgi:DNA-binding LacI/PurR family transcriptional regulator